MDLKDITVERSIAEGKELEKTKEERKLDNRESW